MPPWPLSLTRQHAAGSWNVDTEGQGIGMPGGPRGRGPHPSPFPLPSQARGGEPSPPFGVPRACSSAYRRKGTRCASLRGGERPAVAGRPLVLRHADTGPRKALRRKGETLRFWIHGRGGGQCGVCPATGAVFLWPARSICGAFWIRSIPRYGWGFFGALNRTETEVDPMNRGSIPGLPKSSAIRSSRDSVVWWWVIRKL